MSVSPQGVLTPRATPASAFSSARVEALLEDSLSRVRIEECRLVQLGGLEPPTSCSTDRRSNQLSYNCILDRPRKGVAERGGN
jgi:hypothetical protein